MQNDRISLRHAAASSLRAAKELHKVNPNIFPVITLYALIYAVLPYVTVFFSAQLYEFL